MKKTIALVIIGMFVLSLVPFVLADEANATQKQGREEIAAARKAVNESRERVKELREERKEAYQERKDKRSERLEILKEGRQAKRVGKTNESAEKFKSYLLKTAEQWIYELNEIKSKVQATEEFTEQQKSEIISKIDSQISSLNSIKSQIEAAATMEQIKTAAKSLRELRVDSFRKVFSLRVLSARIQGHINRANVLEKRLEVILQKAKEKGIDINAEVTSFKEKITLAEDKNKQSQSKLIQVFDLMKSPSADKEQLKTLMNEVRQLLKEAGSALKDVHNILKSIVIKIKAAEPKSTILEE